nr:12927_t:CDS:2 [Entrophospora candida]
MVLFETFIHKCLIDFRHAFVEFEDINGAENAYNGYHGTLILQDHKIKLSWDNRASSDKANDISTVDVANNGHNSDKTSNTTGYMYGTDAGICQGW